MKNDMPLYELPNCLKKKISKEIYIKWLDRKAGSLRRRDRKNSHATKKGYKEAIHQAVNQSKGRDAYTGGKLVWSLISKWKNEDAKKGGDEYMRRFALLPTVDHFSGRGSKPDFRICSWRTNDAKGNMSLKEFRDFCKKVIRYSKYRS